MPNNEQQTNAITAATQAWDFIYQNRRELLATSKPEHLIKLAAELNEMRADVCAKHPDACQVCHAEIVADKDRICACAGRTCHSCAGKNPALNCPHCRSDALLLPLVAADKISITFSAMARSDFVDIKPQMRALLDTARERLEQQHLRTLSQEEDNAALRRAQEWGESLVQAIQNSQAGMRTAAAEPPAQAESEEESEEEEEQKEEPPAQRQRVERQPAARANKEDKKDKEISTLLDFCAKHGDQRSFVELLADLDELRQWNHQRINIGAADSMDLNTLTEQWFLTANLAGISGEARFLFFLRQGEFFERLSNLCEAEGGLNHADEQGNAQHYTSALDYLRRVLNYQKKDEDQLRACHQFFEVWKEWHPIIAVAQSQFSWSWLKETLTKKKLLEAVRARKAIQALQQLPPAVPAPLLYNIPPRWREYPRRPDNVRALDEPTVLTFKGQVLQPVLLDSYFLPKCAQTLGFDPAVLLDILRASPGFVPRENREMRYRGSVLPRDKFFAVRSPTTNEQGEPLELRKYNYPGFQYESMLHYHDFTKVPGVKGIADKLQELIVFNNAAPVFNHAIGTLYTKEKDEIGYHHDKMADIAADSLIVSLSLGDKREFHFCKPGNEQGAPDFVQILEAGDVFILGPRTNAAFKHAVAPIDQEKKIEREGGAFSDRVSIVLRNITTTMTRAELLTRLRLPVAPVPQPRLVGIELNPGPFPLEPAIASQALSTMPPPDFIAEAQQALSGMSAVQQQELFIRLAFTTNQLYREAAALQQRAQQSAHTVPDPRHVDPNNAQQAAVIAHERATQSGKSRAVFLKHHTTVRQAVERQEQDFIIAGSRLRESAAKLHALNTIEAEEQRRLERVQQAKALTAQAAQLQQQARALTSPSFSSSSSSSSALVALK